MEILILTVVLVILVGQIRIYKRFGDWESMIKVYDSLYMRFDDLQFRYEGKSQELRYEREARVAAEKLLKDGTCKCTCKKGDA